MLPPLQLEADAPWKKRFRTPILFGAQVAALTPQRGLVVGNFHTTTFQLYNWNLANGQLRRATGLPGGLFEGYIDPTGHYLYYLEDTEGSELGHLVRIAYDVEPQETLAEDLTPDMPPYTLRGVGFSRNGRMMALNPVNAEGFQLITIALDAKGAASPPRQVYVQEKEAWYALLSYDGSLVAMISTTRAGGQRRYSTLAISTVDDVVVDELWDGLEASVEAVGFAPVQGDTRLLATTTRTAFTRPLIWDPISGARTDYAFSEIDGELYALDWSPDAKSLLLCQIERARQQLYLCDIESGSLHRIPHEPGAYCMPGFGGSVFLPDGRILGLWDSSAHPTRVVAIDPMTGEAVADLVAEGSTIEGTPRVSVEFPSSDGTMIQAWLGAPMGAAPFPTIIEMHGGPHFAGADMFSPVVQALIDHGFAVCSVNYRGSTTFGREFKEQIWGDIGHWEVEDIVAARRWLIDKRIAAPQTVLLMGESYGGYLTLLTLGKYPELWAGGISLAGTADALIDYEDANDALKAAIEGWYGGTPTEKPELYRRSSPMTYAEQLQAPILAFQGQNDTRVAPRQMQVYEERLRALDKPIEVVWFDAGHGAFDADMLLQFTEKILQFAYAVVDHR